MTPEGYSARVRQLFAAPAHAGPMPPGLVVMHAAEAAAPERGGWVRFEAAAVEQGRLVAVRFHAWGCPHFIAACESAAAALEGGPLGAAAELTAAGLARELAVPAEKLGRLLVIEDALRALAAGGRAAQ